MTSERLLKSGFRISRNDVLLSAAVQNLKKGLIEYVDQKLPRVRPNNQPASRSSEPAKNQPNPASNQP